MKSTVKPILIIFFVFAVISCTKEGNIKSSALTESTANTSAFTIGQRYGGGVIFYIDNTGQHGFIADTVDLPASTWWNGKYIITNASGFKIGSGEKNTPKIVTAQGDSGKYAARRCWNYKVSGYKDWFLPSINELKELYKQKSKVGSFTQDYYWSSSEDNHFPTSIANAMDFKFTSGLTPSDKNHVYGVRAIRKF